MRAEWQRQDDPVELIASENCVSLQVMRVQGAALPYKYAVPVQTLRRPQRWRCCGRATRSSASAWPTAVT
jgi:glycine/serine hydroxymethyltransferase